MVRKRSESATDEKVSPPLRFPCLILHQGNYQIVCFVAKATTLWEILQVNKRDPDKDKGYQRILSPARLASISKFIERGNPIPNSVLVSLVKGTTLSDNGKYVLIPRRKDAGWVIDGQHRLAGAHELHSDIEMLAMAFIDLPLKEQINQFVTINREARGVATSLYYDLLKHLPSNKSDSDIAKERASDIADMLRRDENSPFFGRVVVVTSPKRGEVSLTNFVRKVAPLVQRNKGKFHLYNVEEQKGIVDNYYKALANMFPAHSGEKDCVFFQTLGFGALIHALPTVFDLTMKNSTGFTVKDVSETLKNVEDFPFEEWTKLGTGNAAEVQAGEDLRTQLLMRIEGAGDGKSLRL